MAVLKNFKTAIPKRKAPRAPGAAKPPVKSATAGPAPDLFRSHTAPSKMPAGPPISVKTGGKLKARSINPTTFKKRGPNLASAPRGGGTIRNAPSA
jgi:hypothetical protein